MIPTKYYSLGNNVGVRLLSNDMVYWNSQRTRTSICEFGI